jgi:hypothetical protein
MKRKPFSKAVLMLLISGLLLTSFVPLLSRYFIMPDVVKGFLTGLGLALEFIALVKAQRSKKGINCGERV